MKVNHDKNRTRINQINHKFLNTLQGMTMQDLVIEVDPNYDQWVALLRRVTINTRIHFVFADPIGQSKFFVQQNANPIGFTFTSCEHSVCATSDACECGGMNWGMGNLIVTIFTETMYHYTYTQIREQFKNTANRLECEHKQYVSLMWPNTVSECGSVFNASLNEKQTRKISEQFEFKTTVVNICPNDKYAFPSATDTLCLVLAGSIITSFGYVSLEKVFSDDNYYIFEMKETPTEGLRPSPSIVDDFYKQNRVILTCNCESNSIVGGAMGVKWYLALVTSQMVTAMQSRMTASMTVENIFGRSTGMQFSGYTLGVFMMLYFEKCNSINFVSNLYVKHGELSGPKSFTETLAQKFITALTPRKSEAESMYSGMDEYWNTFAKAEEMIKSTAIVTMMAGAVVTSIIAGVHVPVLTPIALSIIKSTLSDPIKKYFINEKSFKECLMRQRVKLHVEQFTKILRHPDRYNIHKLRFWKFTPKGTYQQKISYLGKPDDKLCLPSLILQHNEYVCTNCDTSDASTYTTVCACGNRFCAFCQQAHMCAKHIPIPRTTQLKTRRMVAGPCDIVVAKFSHTVNKTMPAIGSGDFKVISGVAYFMGGFNANPRLFQQSSSATHVYKVLTAYGRGTYQGGKPWRSMKQSSNLHVTMNYICPAHTAGMQSLPMRQPYCTLCMFVTGLKASIQLVHKVQSYSMGMFNVPFMHGLNQITPQLTKTVMTLVTNITSKCIPSKIVTHLKHGVFITQKINQTTNQAMHALLSTFNPRATFAIADLKRRVYVMSNKLGTLTLTTKTRNALKTIKRACMKGKIDLTKDRKRRCCIRPESQNELLQVVDGIKEGFKLISEGKRKGFGINDEEDDTTIPFSFFEKIKILKSSLTSKTGEELPLLDNVDDEDLCTDIEDDSFDDEALIESIMDEIELLPMKENREEVEIGENVLVRHNAGDFVAKVTDGYHHSDLYKIGPSIFLGNRTESNYNWKKYMNRMDDSILNPRSCDYEGTPFERVPVEFDCFPGFKQVIDFDTKVVVYNDKCRYLKMNSAQRHQPELKGHYFSKNPVLKDCNYFKIADYLEGKSNMLLEELKMRYEKATRQTEKSVKLKDEMFVIKEKRKSKPKKTQHNDISDEDLKRMYHNVVGPNYTSNETTPNNNPIDGMNPAIFQLPSQNSQTNPFLNMKISDSKQKRNQTKWFDDKEDHGTPEPSIEGDNEDCSNEDDDGEGRGKGGKSSDESPDEQADKFIEKVKKQLDTTLDAQKMVFRILNNEYEDNTFDDFVREEFYKYNEDYMHVDDVEAFLTEKQMEWMEQKIEKSRDVTITTKIKGRKFIYGTRFGTWDEFCTSHKLPVSGESAVAYCLLFERRPVKDVLVGFTSHHIYHDVEDQARFLLAADADELISTSENGKEDYVNFVQKLEEHNVSLETKRLLQEREDEMQKLHQHIEMNMQPRLEALEEEVRVLRERNRNFVQMQAQIEYLKNNPLAVESLGIKDTIGTEQVLEQRVTNQINDHLTQMIQKCVEYNQATEQRNTVMTEEVRLTRENLELAVWATKYQNWVNLVLQNKPAMLDTQKWLTENQQIYNTTLELQAKVAKSQAFLAEIKNERSKRKHRVAENEAKKREEEELRQKTLQEQEANRLKAAAEQKERERVAELEALQLLQKQQEEKAAQEKAEQERIRKEEEEKLRLAKIEQERIAREQKEKEDEDNKQKEMQLREIKANFIKELNESKTYIEPALYAVDAKENGSIKLDRTECASIKGTDLVTRRYFILSDQVAMKKMFQGGLGFLLDPKEYGKMLELESLYPCNRTQWALFARWRDTQVTITPEIDEEVIINHFTQPYDDQPIDDLYVSVVPDGTVAIALMLEAKKLFNQLNGEGRTASGVVIALDKYMQNRSAFNWTGVRSALREYVLITMTTLQPTVSKNAKLKFLTMHEKLLMAYTRLHVKQQIKIRWIDGVGAVGKTKAWDDWSKDFSTYMAHLTKSSKIANNPKSKTYQNALFGKGCGAFFCDEIGKAQIELLATYAMMFTEKGDIIYGFSDSCQGIGLGNHVGHYTEFNAEQIRRTRLHLFKRDDDGVMYANRQWGPISDLIYYLCYSRGDSLFKSKYPGVEVRCRQRNDRPALQAFAYEDPTEQFDINGAHLVTNSPFYYLDENIDLLTVYRQKDVPFFSSKIDKTLTSKQWATNAEGYLIQGYYNVTSISQSQGHTEFGKYATYLSVTDGMWDDWNVVVSLTRPTHSLFVNRSVFRKLESYGKMLMGSIYPCLENEAIGNLLNCKMGTKDQKKVCKGIVRATTSYMETCKREQTKEDKYAHIVSYIRKNFKEGTVHDLTPGSFTFSKATKAVTYDRSEFEALIKNGNWMVKFSPTEEKTFKDNDVYFIDAPTNRISAGTRGQEYIDQNALLNWISEQRVHIIYKVSNPYGIGKEIITNTNVYNKYHNPTGTWQKLEWYFHYDPDGDDSRRRASIKNPQIQMHQCIEFPSIPMSEVNTNAIYEIWSIDEAKKLHEQLTVIESAGEIITPLSFYPNRRTNHLFATLHFHKHDPTPSQTDRKNRFCNALYANACHMICENFPTNKQAKCDCGRTMEITDVRNTQVVAVNLKESNIILDEEWPSMQQLRFSDHETEHGMVPLITTKKKITHMRGIRLRNKRNIIPLAQFSHISPLEELKTCVPINFRNSQKNRMVSFIERLYKTPNVNLYLASFLAHLVPYVLAWCYKNKKLPDMKPISDWRDFNEKYAAFLKKKPAHRKRAYEERKDMFDDKRARTFSTFIKNEKLVKLYNEEGEYKAPRNICAMHIDSQYAGMVSDACMDEIKEGRTFADDEITITGNMTGEQLAEDMFNRPAKWDTDFGKYDRSIHYLIKIAIITCTFILWCFGSGVSLIDMFNIGAFFSSGRWLYNKNEHLCNMKWIIINTWWAIAKTDFFTATLFGKTFSGDWNTLLLNCMMTIFFIALVAFLFDFTEWFARILGDDSNNDLPEEMMFMTQQILTGIGMELEIIPRDIDIQSYNSQIALKDTNGFAFLSPLDKRAVAKQFFVPIPASQKNVTNLTKFQQDVIKNQNYVFNFSGDPVVKALQRKSVEKHGIVKKFDREKYRYIKNDNPFKANNIHCHEISEYSLEILANVVYQMSPKTLTKAINNNDFKTIFCDTEQFNFMSDKTDSAFDYHHDFEEMVVHF